MASQESSTLLIVGAGGHAKVVIELFQAAGQYKIAGLINKNVSCPVLGLPVIGTDHDLESLWYKGIRFAFVAIGNNTRRLEIGRRLQNVGFEIANAISPAAVISTSANLGCGIAIMAGAVINADTHVGDFAVANTNCSIDHDCVVGDGAHVAPGCTIAGNVKIGRLACVGAGTTVIPGVNIGERASIGAGSCVLRDIPNNARAWGVPARVV